MQFYKGFCISFYAALQFNNRQDDIINKDGKVAIKMNSGFVIFSRAVALFISFLLLTPVISACSSKPQPPQKPPVPVTAAVVVQKTVPVQLKAIGNVEAYSTVAVKSQTGGVLTRVHFREGQDVQKGALLFTIDPRPYEAELKKAEADLAKDTAQFENARIEAKRYEELVGKGYVARSQYDQVRTIADSLEAAVTAGKALVENARLQLSYCSIHSPVNGRTGNLLANEGNLIKANADTPMVTINQVRPVYVTFSAPEQYLSDIKKYMSAGKIKVAVSITKNEAHPVEGVLTFVDNAVDMGTGSIKLKATFGNENSLLWPGQFVDVVMTLTTQPNAIVVASPAIQTGQNGQYVFLIKDDLTVESRLVEVGRTLNSETVIDKGLQAGEKVVTDGQLRLVPGAKIQIKEKTDGK
jgi:membrane fusion protein, multidrug efflux system